MTEPGQFLQSLIMALVSGALLVAWWRAPDRRPNSRWFIGFLTVLALFNGVHALAMLVPATQPLLGRLLLLLVPATLLLGGGVLSLVLPALGATRPFRVGLSLIALLISAALLDLIIGSGIFFVGAGQVSLPSEPATFHLAYVGDAAPLLPRAPLMVLGSSSILLTVALLFRINPADRTAQGAMLLGTGGLLAAQVIFRDLPALRVFGPIASLVLVPALIAVALHSAPSLYDRLGRPTADQPIGRKLSFGFGALVLVTALVTLSALYAISLLNQQIEDALSRQHIVLSHSGELVEGYRAARRAEQDFALQARTDGIQVAEAGAYAEWRQSVAQVNAALVALGRRPLNDAQRQRLAQIEQGIAEYTVAAEDLFDAYRQRGDRRRGASAEWLVAVEQLDQHLNEFPIDDRRFDNLFVSLRSGQFAFLTTEDPALGEGLVRRYEALESFMLFGDVEDPLATRVEAQQLLSTEKERFGLLLQSVRNLDRAVVSLEQRAARLQEVVNEFNGAAASQFDTGIERVELVRRNTTLWLLVIGLFGLVVAYVFAQLLSRQISRPVVALGDAADLLASGELGVAVPRFHDDEVGATASAFDQMRRRLRQTLESLESQVRERTGQLEAAAEVAASATQERNLDRLLESATALIVSRFETIYHAQVFLIDRRGEGEWAELRASTGEVGKKLLERRHRLQVGSASVIGRVTADNAAVLARANDPDTVHRFNELLPQTQAELALPIRREGRVIGALDVQSMSERGISPGDISIFQTLADQLAAAIDNARLFTDLDDALSESERLYHSSSAIASAKEPDELLDLLERTAAELPDLDRTTVVLFQSLDEAGRGGVPRQVRHWVRNPEQRARPDEALERPVARQLWALLSQGEVGVADLAGEQSIESELRDWFTALGSRSVIALPLSDGGTLQGALLLQRAEAGLPRASVVQTFRLLAPQITVAFNRFTLLDQLADRVLELQELRSAFLDLGGATSPQELVETLTARATTLLDAHASAIYRYDEDANEMELVAYDNLDRSLMGSRWGSGEGCAGQVLDTREPFLIEDYGQWSGRDEELPERYGSVAAVPLLWQGRLLGAVTTINRTDQRHFSRNDLRRLTLFADQAALTIENARLLDTSRRATRRLATAAEVSRAATSLLELDDMLSRAVELIREEFGYYHVQLFLIDESRLWAELRASTGQIGRELLTRRHRLGVGSRSVIGRVTEAGEPVVARSSEYDPETIHQFNEFLPETRAELAVPLVIGDEVIGALDVQSTDPAAFSDEVDLEMLRTLSDQLSVAVQNARLFERTQRTLHTNEKLYNAGRAIAAAESPHEIVRTLRHEIAPEGVGDVAIVAMEQDVDGRLASLRVVASADGPVDPAGPPPRVPIGAEEQWFRAELERLDAPLVIEDVPGARHVDRATRDRLVEMGIRAVMLVPLAEIDGERLLFHFCYPEPRHFTLDEIERAATIASQTAISLENLRLLDDLALRARRLSDTNALTSRLLATSSLDELFEIATREIHAIMEVDQVGLLLFDVPNDTARVVAQYRSDGSAPAIGVTFPISSNYTSVWMLENKRAVVASDIHRNEILGEHAAMLAAQGIRSTLFAPLVTRGQVIGSLGLDAVEAPREWSEADVSLALNIANTLTSAIESTRLFEQVSQSLDQTRTLYEASRAISEADTLDGIAQAISTHLTGGQGQVALLAFDVAPNGELRDARLEGTYPSASGIRALARPQHLKILDRLGARSEPVRVREAASDPRLEEREIRLLDRLGLQSLLSIPVEIADGWRGAILVGFDSPHALPDALVERLATIGSQSATAVQNRELLAQTRASLRDSQALYRAGTRINEATSPDELLAAIAPLAEPIAPEQLLLIRFDDDVPESAYPETGRVDAALGEMEIFDPAAPLDADRFPPLGTHPAGQSLLAPDLRRARVLDERTRATLEAQGLRGLLLLPMRLGSRTLGWLALLSSRRMEVSPGDVRQLQTIAQQLAIAGEGQRLLDDTRRRAWREEQIARITGRLHSTTEPEEILRIGLSELKSALGVKRAMGWSADVELLADPRTGNGSDGSATSNGNDRAAAPEADEDENTQGRNGHGSQDAQKDGSE